MADNSPASTVQPFRDNAEVADAIANPLYRRSPAYRNDVEDRIAVTNFLKANVHGNDVPQYQITGTVEGAVQGAETDADIRARSRAVEQFGGTDLEDFVKRAAEAAKGRRNI